MLLHRRGYAPYEEVITDLDAILHLRWGCFQKAF